jgi:hypothetical protein
MGVREAIREADALLPGEPVDEGQDPRWQAVIAVGEYIGEEPDAVWSFIGRWGGHPQEDLRDAIATCLLEHLLERHFGKYFPLVQELAVAEPLFGDMLLRCWRFGQTMEPGNAACFEALRTLLLERERA